MKLFIKKIQLCFWPMLFGGILSVNAQPKKIGFLMDDFNAARWSYDSSFFAQRVRELGHQVIIKYCDSDTALQHQQATNLIKEGIDVLVIIPENSLAASTIVETAQANNIPVIAYDRLILNCDLSYYISFDGETVGELQARYILEQIGHKGTIMIINGPEHDINSLLFKKGQMKVLQPYVDNGQVTIAYDKFLKEWTSLESFMETNDFFYKYTQPIHGIIAANDMIAQGVIEALSIYKPNEFIPLTGQDASVDAYHNIKNNLQGMTVYKPIDQLAFQAAELACSLATKKKIGEIKKSVFNGKKNVPFLKLYPISISKENCSTLLSEKNYLRSEYLIPR